MADAEGLDEDGVIRGRLNPIACIHCRQRKRKCDRQLPYCLQCSHDPDSCRYPEQHKRGIPIGFITRTVARLAETEEALFKVLQILENSQDARVSLKYSSGRKAERLEEWDALPLQSLDDIKTWFRQKSVVESHRAEPPGVRLSQSTQSQGPVLVTTPERRFTVPIVDLASPETSSPQLRNGINNSASGAAGVVASGPAESAAKALESKYPNMYF